MENLGTVILFILGAIIYFWLQTRSEQRAEQPKDVVSPNPPVVVEAKPIVPQIPQPNLTIDEVLEEYAVTEIKKNSKIMGARIIPLKIEADQAKELKPKEVLNTKLQLDNTEKANAYKTKVKPKNEIVQSLTNPKTFLQAMVVKEILEKYDFDKKFDKF